METKRKKEQAAKYKAFGLSSDGHNNTKVDIK